ncbi:MAG: CPBP family intramembrane metalloprotease [Acidobacteria bacterium]|nr:CPBP family intramembrane metalloprotease [Acidobacteriota bacterium]
MEYPSSAFGDAGESGDGLPFQPLPPAAPEPPPSPAPRREPGYWDLLQLLIFALVSLGVLIVLTGVALTMIQRVTGAPMSFTEGPLKLVSMLVIQGLWWALVLAFIYYVAVVKYGVDFAEALAWRPSGSMVRQIAAGFALAIGVTALANILPMPDTPSPLEELLSDATGYLPLFVVFGVLIAPAVEEAVFRGFVFGVLERAHGTKAAIVATAALFAAPHSTQYGGRWQILLILFLVGVVLGAVRAQSGSTRATTVIHAAYNSTFMLALIASEVSGVPIDV